MFKRLVATFLSVLLAVGFLPVKAAVLSYMPEPSQMITAGAPYDLPCLIGMRFKSDNPFEFSFILRSGNVKPDKDTLTKEVERLGRYFLAALTIPESELWVNLSPYEKDRVATDALALTDLGADMLGEDYVLKQLTASLTYPEGTAGKAFWSKVYAQLDQKLGRHNIPVSAFNKVWIMPDKIKVLESDTQAVITASRLKVSLEQDYVAQRASASLRGASDARDEAIASSGDKLVAMASIGESRLSRHDAGVDAFKQSILPIIEKEVNTGRHFARLRQIYSAVVMAIWFKNKLKNTILAQAYFDQKKLKGADYKDPAIREKVYAEYVKAFNVGVYNYVRKEKTTKRRYTCGGIVVSGATDSQHGSFTEVVAALARLKAELGKEGQTEPEAAMEMDPVATVPQSGAEQSAIDAMADAFLLLLKDRGAKPVTIEGWASELREVVALGDGDGVESLLAMASRVAPAIRENPDFMQRVHQAQEAAKHMAPPQRPRSVQPPPLPPGTQISDKYAALYEHIIELAQRPPYNVSLAVLQPIVERLRNAEHGDFESGSQQDLAVSRAWEALRNTIDPQLRLPDIRIALARAAYPLFDDTLAAITAKDIGVDPAQGTMIVTINVVRCLDTPTQDLHQQIVLTYRQLRRQTGGKDPLFSAVSGDTLDGGVNFAAAKNIQQATQGKGVRLSGAKGRAYLTNGRLAGFRLGLKKLTL